jgi:AraC-like DNA-binding protein/CheY-like chemotaxis protein
MPANTASTPTLQKLQQKGGVRLKRICLFGLRPAAVRGLGRFLGRHFNLIVTKDEHELLSTIRSVESPDGLVLDAKRSGTNLRELIQKVRSAKPPDSKGANLPIFIFAQSDDTSLYGDTKNLGVQGFFQKPGDIWKLAEAIHRELGPMDAGTETVVFQTGPEAIVIGAIKYVEENLVGIKSSTDVSKHLGVTREHLSRQFTRYTGQTLWDFITTYRVLRAKQLLIEKDLLVKQISREVGFNCESSFFRAFTKKTGFTPEDFRRTRRS